MSIAEARWATRIQDTGALAPYWLGLCVVTGYLLLRCAFDGIYLAIWGFPADVYPLWQGVWWPEVVNATLVGFVPAALLIARRGIDRDMSQLKPWLPHSDVRVADLRVAATGPAGFAGRAFMLSGIVGGVWFVFIDPSLTLGSDLSLSNPSFVWTVWRLPLFIWVTFVLIVTDLNATRSYLHLGRDLIEVDLLDVQSLIPFARRGLRSALTWVVFLIIFSLFWIGNAASEHNLMLFVPVLAMAIGAYIVPLVGVHSNIVSVKRATLDRLRDEIRIERATSTSTQADTDSPKLANLIAYYQLIDGTREWPIDAANLLRFFMYLLIGLGSWLGGAFVELMLDRTLSG